MTPEEKEPYLWADMAQIVRKIIRNRPDRAQLVASPHYSGWSTFERLPLLMESPEARAKLLAIIRAEDAPHPMFEDVRDRD